jgi:hypothetical protein
MGNHGIPWETMGNHRHRQKYMNHSEVVQVHRSEVIQCSEGLHRDNGWSAHDLNIIAMIDNVAYWL